MLYFFLSSLAFAQGDTLWPMLSGSEKDDTETQAPPTSAELLSLFDPKKISIPISYEPRVVEWIEKFRTSHKGTLQRWIIRSGLYEKEILNQLAQHNLPRELLYLAMIESGFNPQATSHAQAVGIWQFIPETGKDYNLRIDNVVDERRDFVRSTEAAIAYLSYLKLKIGYWHLAMAAYNAGEGRVQNAILKYNDADFWRLSTQNALPEETQDYVPRIIAAAIVATDPKLFDIHIPPKERSSTLKMTRFTPKKSISLATISSKINISVEDFRRYNPHIIASYLPHSSEYIRIYLPLDIAEKFYRNVILPQKERDQSGRSWLENNKTDIAAHQKSYTVMEGDTLDSIAKHFSIPKANLIRWNKIENEKITVGQKLLLLAPAVKKWIAIVVGKKDTLKSLARKYNCTVEDIKKWNALSEDKVPTGRQLFIKVQQ